jgi:hypothetical protein
MLTHGIVQRLVPEGINCALNGDFLQPTGITRNRCFCSFPEFELSSILLPPHPAKRRDWMGLRRKEAYRMAPTLSAVFRINLRPEQLSAGSIFGGAIFVHVREYEPTRAGKGCSECLS